MSVQYGYFDYTKIEEKMIDDQEKEDQENEDQENEDQENEDQENEDQDHDKEEEKPEYTVPGEQENSKPSKDEYNVAKWLRRSVKTKKTKFLSHNNVEYFTANKALDALLKSEFVEGSTPIFTTREHAIEFLDIMLEHKFFHRAKKVPVFPEELKGNTKKKSLESSCCSAAADAPEGPWRTSNDELQAKERQPNNRSTYRPRVATTTTTTTTSSPSSKKDNKEKDDNKIEKTTDVDSQIEGGGGNGNNGGGNNVGDDTTNQPNKEKRKRKIKLDMHPDQIFVDGSEAYVWIYDPIPLHYWIYGLILVMGAIIVCLFPLWPPMLRDGVYYLTIAAAGFLGFILVLTIVRLIVFVIILVLSGGKLYFSIFPNLTEDVGFFESFWPLYESNYASEIEKAKAIKKLNKKKKKEKDSDAEDADEPVGLIETEKIENVKEHDADIEQLHHHHHHVETGDESTNDQEIRNRKKDDTKGSQSGSESESGSRSSTGKDFEMVDPNDVDTS